MLRIRFSRTGKKGQPSFRIVVAEARSPIQGGNLEIVGNYLPARDPKIVTIKKDRIEHWIKMGALPTDSVAMLLKKEGMTNMEKYIVKPRDLKRKKRKGGDEAEVAPTVAAAKPATEEKTAESTPEPNEEKVEAPAAA